MTTPGQHSPFAHCPRTLVDAGTHQPRDMVLCGCGRFVNADLMYDVSDVPAGIFAEGQRYVCEACTATAVYRGDLTRAAFVHYTGGSSAHIARAHGKDQREHAAGNVRHSPHTLQVPASVLARALAEAPAAAASAAPPPAGQPSLDGKES